MKITKDLSILHVHTRLNIIQVVLTKKNSVLETYALVCNDEKSLTSENKLLKKPVLSWSYKPLQWSIINCIFGTFALDCHSAFK